MNEHELDCVEPNEIRICDKIEIKKNDNGHYSIYEDGKLVEHVTQLHIYMDVESPIPVVSLIKLVL